MIDEKLIREVAEHADMIVDGFAFTHKADGFVSVVSIHPPYHAAVINNAGELIESDMDDIEFSIKRRRSYKSALFYCLSARI